MWSNVFRNGELFVFIREWCESKGIIQARVVDHLDVDKSSVSHWWKKEVRPDPHHVRAIADMLGIDPRWLHYDPKQISSKDMDLMELWWSLEPIEKRKAKTVLAAYFSDVDEASQAEGSTKPLPSDVAHLARMKVALDEQGKAIGETIVARLAGKPDPKTDLCIEIVAAAREATRQPKALRTKGH